MKSLAQLKRDAKTGTIKTRCIFWCGKPISDDTPERITGVRPIVGSNSKSIFFLRSDGQKSELSIDRASLIDYTDDAIVTYYPGYRPPTASEQRILDGWSEIESTKDFQDQLQRDVYTDGSSTYWQEVKYFRDHDASYLMGFEEKKGCKLDFNRRGKDPAFIRDKNVRGEIENIYLIEKGA